jgi:hypothetical protein
MEGVATTGESKRRLREKREEGGDRQGDREAGKAVGRRWRRAEGC